MIIVGTGLALGLCLPFLVLAGQAWTLGAMLLIAVLFNNYVRKKALEAK